MYLEQHLPVLQVIIPLFLALINVFSFNSRRSWGITVCAGVISFTISILLFFQITHNNPSIYYNIGDWSSEVGIEYKVFADNIKLLLCINFIFLIFTLLILPTKISKLDQSKYGYLFYSILLLFQTGALGIIITNDIFNLYVSIEIMSLASYTILSYSDNKKSTIAALDYLIIGSIAATLILLAIGIIFYLTGSLNIEIIHEFFQNNKIDKNLLKFSTSLIFLGIFVKIALFPFNSWMINLYKVADIDILAYISGVSVVSNFYIFIKLTYYAIPYDMVFDNASSSLITLMANIAIILYAYNACFAKNLRLIVINSSAVSVGYMCLIYLNSSEIKLIFIYLVTDAISKFALFSLVKYAEFNGKKIYIVPKIFRSSIIGVLICFVIINNAGLPFSVNFLNKVNLLAHLLTKESYYSFTSVIISSFLSLIYNYLILQNIFFMDTKSVAFK